MGVMPVERHRLGGDQDNEIARLQAQLAAAQAEAAMLRGQVSDLTRIVAAEADPAVQQAIRDGQPPGRHRRPPEARWLRAVPAVVVMAFRPARHKILAGLAAASVAVVVAAPGMSLAPWTAGAPPAQAHARGAPSAAARAVTAPPGKGKGRGPSSTASPPPRRPTSPPGKGKGKGKPGPSPAATATDAGTPSPDAGTATPAPAPGTDTPSPAPDAATATPAPAVTSTAAPDPPATPAGCPPPGKHKG